MLRHLPLPGLQTIVGGAHVVVTDGEIVMASPRPVVTHAKRHRVVRAVRVRILPRGHGQLNMTIMRVIAHVWH